MINQCRIYVGGVVVGVGFRAWTKKQAKIFGLYGWVKNVFDKPTIFGSGGGVEVLLQGEKEKINKMINLLKIGPINSRVSQIKFFWEKPEEIFTSFEIKK